MEGEINYAKYSESELIEMFGRLDPRYAPTECARLGKYLAERDYIIEDGGSGPGSAIPSPSKLLSLIGSSQPLEWKVDYGKSIRPFGPTQNAFGFVGFGTILTDGIFLWLSGRVSGVGPLFSSKEQSAQLSFRQIANVESEGCVVRFGYSADEEEGDSICLTLADRSAADGLVAILPKRRTKNFRSQIGNDVVFAARAPAQSLIVSATGALIAVNTLVFIATLFAGAEWLVPVGRIQIAWGANFGPYTADGEWWRLVTSLFIHFGIAHLMANMIALAVFGPVVERLYGTIVFLLIFILSGVAGGLASIAWHPYINSAGASGAIFGILGALLAVPFRARNKFPMDLLRPIRDVSLLFLGLSLYAGFRYTGVDNAAHLGGGAAGLLVGLSAARSATEEDSTSSRNLLRFGKIIVAALLVLAIGFWSAQRAWSSMTGEGLFWRTAHWIRINESSIDKSFNSALSVEKNGTQKRAAIIKALEDEVIPFWRKAGDRLATIELPTNSTSAAALDRLQNFADGRADALQALDNGLRKNDQQAISKANDDLKQIEEAFKGDRPP